jgi:beta-N-acetylhexosaminidase
MSKKVLIGLLVFLASSPAFSQSPKSRWVDSVFQTMSTEEKAGQLFMISISPYGTPEKKEEWIEVIKDHHPGGIIITEGGPKSHSNFLNQLQSKTKIPLLVGINAEWGLGQTLDSVMNFQKPLVMSAVSDSLTTALAEEIGKEMKLLGIHLNFAPNSDVDIREEVYPLSLNYMSDDKNKVASKSLAFLKGLQNQNILACAKHSPNAEKDKLITVSKKKKLPDSIIYFDANRIDTLDFFPFQKMIDGGLPALLTTHLHFSSLDRKQPIPASISQIFISEVLKKRLKFQGLTFTEIPYLQKISNKVRAGETELLAFTVGNDVLINPENINASIRKIVKALKKNQALRMQLDATVKKILAAKYDAGLSKRQNIDTDNIHLKLNSLNARLLKNEITSSAVTVVKNSSSSIPVKAIENKRFASLSIGKELQNEFNHYLGKYAVFENFAIRTYEDTVGLKTKLNTKDIIVVGIFPFASQFEKDIIPLIRQLATTHEVIVCHFSDPFALQNYSFVNSLVTGYTEANDVLQATAQILFGGMNAKGVLPVTASAEFTMGKGIPTPTQDRVTYTLPENAGMDSKTLEQIEPIAREAIDNGATPGCYVMVVKDGKVIYDRSFGWLTYENKVAVTDETIYDLASVTKVSATLQTVMFMHEKGLIDINKKVSVYLPELKNTNKKDITIIDVLTHQSGLIPFMYLWPQTMKDSVYLPHYYSKERNPEYPLQVAPGLFTSQVMKDSIWSWVVKSDLLEKQPRTPHTYRYSDLGFMILKHMAEKILNQPIEDFLQQNLYEPLGAYSMGFNPLDRFSSQRIAPTEDDKTYRKTLVLGTVHDERAAMMGGVSGHAGLFGTAGDLAKLGQMLLQGGHYGGVNYYKPQTTQLFATKQFENSRRGLGWDKPVVGDWNSPTSMFASPLTFGHTGFTGTCIWIDPEFNLVYIFLSNRVYPDRNNKILNLNIRPRIQDVVYKSIFNYCAAHPENRN